MQPDQARPEEYEPAFHLLLRHLDAPERDTRAARTVELLLQGQLDPRGLFVLRGASRLEGVIVCELVPGASGILWPPVVVGRRVDLEDRLIEYACHWLRQHGARVGQCLMQPDDAYLAEPLLRNGFAHVTSLAYLYHDLVADLSPPRADFRHGRLHFEPYDPAHPGEFHQTLEASYSETLDCPEVNGARTIEEVIEGYQVQNFDPRRWWLVREDGKPVGVLILGIEADGESWEVGYMGVMPPARRRGLGAAMLCKVLHEARAAGAARVTLSVDERNTPARRLYRQMGFQPDDHRAVFLAIWPRLT
jgi:ribosomal protein S18 acetylase RimI-like enzyme